MNTIFILTIILFIVIIWYWLNNRGIADMHDMPPVPSEALNAQAEEIIKRITKTEYFKKLEPLLEFVKERIVVASETGNCGFILLLDSHTWAATYREGNETGWTTGVGKIGLEVLDKIQSNLYGDAYEPLALSNELWPPYNDQICDIKKEVSKSHGKKITGLSIGEDSFNFAFADDRELDVQFVEDKDGKPAFRVFWEQW